MKRWLPRQEGCGSHYLFEIVGTISNIWRNLSLTDKIREKSQIEQLQSFVIFLTKDY